MVNVTSLMLMQPLAASAVVEAASTRQLGTPVHNGTGRVVRIDAATKYINAERYETLTLKNAKSQSFSWRFDTEIAPAEFPLRWISPAGFEPGNGWVYVHQAPYAAAAE